MRVIRGVNCKLYNRGHNKVYIYDGLYRVVSSTFGRGKSGYNICKFKLLRLPGQANWAARAGRSPSSSRTPLTTIEANN